MNRTEAAKLLTVAGTFDRFIVVDEAVAAAWASALARTSYEAAEARLMAWYRQWDGRTQLSPRVLLPAMPHDVEADVRSAKARGLIDDEWPASEPLPANVQDRLSLARARAVAGTGVAR